MNNNYSKLNPLNPDLDKSLQYKKNLNFTDLFSAGYSFVIGAGIFILLPLIVKFSGGLSWLSFLIGCIICLFTGLSYSKLNMLFPTNDAEYAWILNVLNFDKSRDPDKVNVVVKSTANIIVWIIFFIGIFTSATILVCQANFLKNYANINRIFLISILAAVPTFINIFGSKIATHFSKVVILVITLLFGMVFKFGITDGKHFNELSTIGDKKYLFKNLLNSSFITLFLYNGFQSLVQLSEEAKSQKDIPKSLISSLLFSALLYSLFGISVIALLGVKLTSKSKMTLVDALKTVVSNDKVNLANMVVIMILTNTVLIISLSRSRLLQKMAVRGIAPNIFKSLGKTTEKFDVNNNSKNTTNPINAIIGVGIITFLSTFIRDGAVETLTTLTNMFILISFFIVNALVIVYHYKEKTVNESERLKFVDKEIPFLKGVPWYGFLGLIMSAIYLIKFPRIDTSL